MIDHNEFGYVPLHLCVGVERTINFACPSATPRCFVNIEPFSPLVMLMKVVPATSGRNTTVVKEKMPMAGRLSLVPSTMSLHVGYFSQIQDIVAQELRVCDGVQDLLVFAVDVHLTTYLCPCLFGALRVPVFANDR